MTAVNICHISESMIKYYKRIFVKDSNRLFSFRQISREVFQLVSAPTQSHTKWFVAWQKSGLIEKTFHELEERSQSGRHQRCRKLSNCGLERLLSLTTLMARWSGGKYIPNHAADFCIPPRRNESDPWFVDWRLCKAQHSVKTCINTLAIIHHQCYYSPDSIRVPDRKSYQS